MGKLGDWRSRPRKHGHAPRGATSATYKIWIGMHARCKSPSCSGRYSFGVEIVARWSGADGYANFLRDMGERPPGMSLDRIDHALPYGPDNARWATRQQQSRNRKTVKLTEDDVREIRRRLASGASGRDIVRAYNISDTVVSAIKNRKSWVGVEP